MKQHPLFSMVGLAMKAGAVKSGSYAVEEAIKGHKARLVLVATDASERTKKTLSDMCTHYKTPLELFGTSEELSAAIGKDHRVALAVTDVHFADELRRRLSNH